MKWNRSGRVRNSILPGILLSVFCCGTAWAQAGAPVSPQVPDTLPPFNIVLAGGQHFNKGRLKKHVPVMVVYFDPTCSHCQEFARFLAADIDDFRAARIVFITFVPLSGIMNFKSDYHLDKPWVILGTEGYPMVVQTYYQVRQFPVIALYDRQGKQIRLFREKYPQISTLHDELFGKPRT
jgi:hypothetical protein